MSNDTKPALPEPEALGWYSRWSDSKIVFGYTADQMHAFRAEGVAAAEAKIAEMESQRRVNMVATEDYLDRIGELEQEKEALRAELETLRKAMNRARG